MREQLSNAIQRFDLNWKYSMEGWIFRIDVQRDHALSFESSLKLF